MRPFITPRQRRNLKKYSPLFLVCIVVMLLVALLGSYLHGQTPAHTATLNAIATAEYVELDSALSTFDTIGYPNADLMGNIMPTLHLRFHAASVLDELLVSQYGEQYRLIDPEVYRYINLTMQEIETAASQGSSTSLGIENMTVYMMLLRDSLNTRFDLNGAVLPLQ